MPDSTDPKWVEDVAAWHDNEAILCRDRNGPSAPEYADMHETTAEMLRALAARIAALEAALRECVEHIEATGRSLRAQVVATRARAALAREGGEHE